MGKKSDLKQVKSEPLESIEPEATEEVKLDSDDDATKADSTTKAPEPKAATTDNVTDKSKDKANEAKSDKDKTAEDKDDKAKPAATTDDKESDKKSTTSDKTDKVTKDEAADKDTKSTDKKEATPASEKPQSADKSDEDAPPMPKRPVDPVQQLKDELSSAFPDADAKLVTTVLVASQGNLEHAFSALLYYFDPSNPADIPVPAPATSTGAGAGQAPPGSLAAGAKYGSLTEDEILARKLQQQFEEEDRRARQQRRSKRSQQHQQQQQPRQRAPRDQEQYDNDDDSYDELEQIKETFTQGFEEAKTTINGWVSGFTKKIEELSQDRAEPDQSRQQYQGPLFGALGGSAGNDTRTSKRDGNRVQFDEDPVQITESQLPSIRMNNNDKVEKPATSPAAAASNKKWQPLDANSDKFQVDSDED